MTQAHYHYPYSFSTEGGETLPALQIAYCTYGQLAPAADNVIWVCHALTANADVADWWPGMVGPGAVFDTNKYLVVCANIIGSCYGTTGPSPTPPVNGQPWAVNFPLITPRDMAAAHRLLAAHLGIRQIHLLCGGSLGGQQAVEWAIEEPSFIKQLFLIATNARHSAWGIAFNEAQRMAIEAGPGGLEAARAIAMLSYRSYAMYVKTQTDDTDKTAGFRASSYQRYQGRKLANRFTAASYYVLSKAMDAHNVGRNRGGLPGALQQVTAKTLVVGISSDMLFPVQEQELLARHISNAVLEVIDSPYGHDGFLVETAAIGTLVKKHLTI